MPKWTWVATNRSFVMAFSRPKAPFRAAELWGGSILTSRQAHGRCHLNFLQQSAWPIWSLAIIECCTISDHGASFQFRLLLWMGWRLALLAPALIFRISIDCCSPAITNSSLGGTTRLLGYLPPSHRTKSHEAWYSRRRLASIPWRQRQRETEICFSPA